MSDDPRDLRPADFPVVEVLATRWSDNDVFGHLNNAVYYELFDSVINRWLGDATASDPTALPAMGVVAESGCRFFGEIAYPEPVRVALAVERLGRSSVTYRLALFGGVDGDAAPAAVGRWVHVYVDRTTRRPVELPAVIRAALERLAS